MNVEGWRGRWAAPHTAGLPAGTSSQRRGLAKARRSTGLRTLQRRGLRFIDVYPGESLS